MLQELTNKIKKILPEIEHLKFGCKIGIKCSDSYKIAVISDLEFYYGKTFTAKQIEDKEKHFYWTFDIKDLGKDFEIIGRPITLEDVLRCLEIKPSNVVLSVWCDGTMRISNGEIFLDWQLGKPLHEQSEETIKELNKLI